jgi:hypothetical protein
MIVKHKTRINNEKVFIVRGKKYISVKPGRTPIYYGKSIDILKRYEDTKLDIEDIELFSNVIFNNKKLTEEDIQNIRDKYVARRRELLHRLMQR